MVLVQRRTLEATCLQAAEPKKGGVSRRRSSCEVFSGTAEEPTSPKEWVYYRANRPSWNINTKAPRRTSPSARSGRGLVLRFVCGTLLFWILSLSLKRQVGPALRAFEAELALTVLQGNQAIDFYAGTVGEEAQQTKNLLKALQRAKAALEKQIEARQIKIFYSSGETQASSYQPVDSEITQWLDEKEIALEHKIAVLQTNLKQLSRDFVNSRYGPGPHRVEFAIEFRNHENLPVPQSFIVELAPLDLLPHAVHFFLDLVHHGIWNDTVFLHHEDVRHIIAAAPIDFDTQEIKFRQLDELEWSGLGFPEYSKEMAHEKYTLGFADRGPTFYINTMDNTVAHGPGGQGHHTLPNDADPCFAKIVEGTKVVDSLVRMGLLHTKFEEGQSHPWADSEHTWTRIVSAAIL